MNHLDIHIDPRFRIPYYTYILDGLRSLGANVHFRKLHGGFEFGMSMIVDGRRIFIDTNDLVDVDEDAYAWCDSFGKVNANMNTLRSRPKMWVMGPVFGVQSWSILNAYVQAARLIAAGAPARSTLQGARFQAKTRLPPNSYQPMGSQSDYIFHRSRNWEGKHSGVNSARERFITALEGLPFQVDVGLVTERLKLHDYISLTQRSSIVFNCPAVHGCLGWKLGEYLALGKAIISTPIDRVLPSSLTHGEHIHIVEDDVDAIRTAVVTINRDVDYRKHLEVGARKWFEEYLAPKVVAARVVGLSNAPC